MSSPKVTYSYADGSANTIRPTGVTYPDNTGGTRVLTYDYGTSGGMNDKLSRAESLGFGGTSNLVQPSYLGLGTQVRTDYTQPEVRWDLATGSSPNPYAGLDRFGRVLDNKWTNSSTSATLDQIKYAYDRASNRTTRENTVAKAQTTPKYFDELYGYDGSNRLTQMQRGQLAGTTSITNLRFAQDWGLDPTGNWQQFNEDSDGSGTNDLVQARTANPVNEITDITNSVGTPWVQPGYDAAGNMTTIPQGNEPEEGFTGVYDAWNRLVKLLDEDDNVVAEYAYDGLTRRIKKTTAAETRHYYYNASWQILEERREEFEAWDLLTTSSSSSSSSSTSSSSSSSSDNPSYDFYQYVWGLRYIDGLVFRDRQSTSEVERLYALQDANWNVDALVNTSGSVVERFSYTAYGVPAFLNPNFTVKAGSDYEWDVLYAGYKWDWESGMYQVRWRYLLPLLGCWGSRDPIGYEALDVNIYRYISNAPMNMFDSYGLKCCCCVEDADIHIWNIMRNGYFIDRLDEKGEPALDGNVLVWGHNFDVIANLVLDNKKTTKKDCSIKWYECSDKPASAWAAAGVAPLQWKDSFELFPKAATRSNWNDYLNRQGSYENIKCGRLINVVANDTPYIRRERSRHLAIQIRIMSSPDCGCKNDKIDLWFTQTLVSKAVINVATDFTTLFKANPGETWDYDYGYGDIDDKVCGKAPI